MHTTTCGIAKAKIGITEDKGIPNLLSSVKTNILLLNSALGERK